MGQQIQNPLNVVRVDLQLFPYPGRARDAENKSVLPSKSLNFGIRQSNHCMNEIPMGPFFNLIKRQVLTKSQGGPYHPVLPFLFGCHLIIDNRTNIKKSTCFFIKCHVCDYVHGLLLDGNLYSKESC